MALASTVTCAQMRDLDRRAIEEFGIPGLILMENAGRGAAEHVLALRGSATAPVCILCGRGNNGGDGFVIARHLHNAGVPVHVIAVRPLDDLDPDSDAGVNHRILVRMGIPVRPVAEVALPEALASASVIVDAMLGTGLRGPVTGAVADAIAAVEAAAVPVLAVDIPSGLDADTGDVHGVATHATRTVTFGLPKRGFFCGQGPAHVGELAVVEISLPRVLLTPYLENTR